MEKGRAIELLKLAVPIKALTQQEYADFVEAVNMGMDALEQPTSPDTIDRQAAIDALVQCTNCGDEDTLREYVLKHSLDNGWTGGILEALDAVKDLPPAQPEPTDINAKEAVYNLAEKIGIHQLFALTVELRGEPIQPEPQEGHWIEGKIYRDVIECNCSECGQLMTTAASVRMNYCPNCGAKMTISTK